MRKNYFYAYLIIILSLFITSCNENDGTIISESNETVIEPDFLEKDGSFGLEEEKEEEEAPVQTNLKHYYQYNYTLLKPSNEVDDMSCGQIKTMPLLVGYRKKKVGEVKVSNDEENLYLTFTTDDKKYMKKVYLYIGDKGSVPFYSNGFPNLRKFNYKAFPYYYGGVKKATYVIPLSSINADCFEIVAYSKIYDSNSYCYYSSFAYDSNVTQKYNYSYYSGYYYFKDWVRSFEYCKQKCKQEAIAFGGGGKSTCFIDDGFDQWGWTSGPLNNNVRLSLFVNGNGCDQSNAEFAGWVSISYDKINETVSVRFWTPGESPYIFEETSLYIGSEKYPIGKDGNETIDPSQYPYSHKNLGGIKTDTTYIIQNVPSDFYIIPHAVIYK